MLTVWPLLLLSVSRATILFAVTVVDAPIDNDDAVDEVNAGAFILSLSCGGCIILVDVVVVVVLLTCCCCGGGGGR